MSITPKALSESATQPLVANRSPDTTLELALRRIDIQDDQSGDRVFDHPFPSFRSKTARIEVASDLASAWLITRVDVGIIRS